MYNREEMIKYCYRLLLDRWPSKEEWVNCPYENLDDLKESMLNSDEFYDKHQDIFRKVIVKKLIDDK